MSTHNHEADGGKHTQCRSDADKSFEFAEQRKKLEEWLEENEEWIQDAFWHAAEHFNGNPVELRSAFESGIASTVWKLLIDQTDHAKYQEDCMLLTENILRWGADRGILKNATAFQQTRKTLEESGELLEATASYKALAGVVDKTDAGIADQLEKFHDELSDAVGDIYVTIVMVAGCAGVTPPAIPTDSMVTEYEDDMLVIARDIVSKCHELIQYSMLDCQEHITRVLGEMNCLLADYCFAADISPLECVEQAYDEIKDRKGYLAADGTFHKEEMKT